MKKAAKEKKMNEETDAYGTLVVEMSDAVKQYVKYSSKTKKKKMKKEDAD